MLNRRNTYLKQRNINDPICACTNVIKHGHGYILSKCFSATRWTFHFQTAEKHGYYKHNIGVAETSPQSRISNEPGLNKMNQIKHSMFTEKTLNIYIF